ncbi:hypothetical protein [Paraburkholderia largidicola]|jgi:hypothetical protein|uniref:Lipoprotein n=1 Tax=Paraburkholderia largidicola TaxID=3014751 RepID=A0A7I8BRF6_9BURK|nr:hypothetical protein [Paraburkholderia sp. PGU16]BCF90751.1 hypothetical protein PPGU16_38180 [Paraburkholderia sp. PGU16]
MNGLSLSSLRVSAIVVLASFVLAACGADDAATVSNPTPTASQANTAAPSASPSGLAMPPATAGNSANTFNTPAANSMNAADNARSDAQDSAAILSAQASIAADNQQVAPVLRYAPGEESH